jgi:DNA-binding XRE family transcriptional regulator
MCGKPTLFLSETRPGIYRARRRLRSPRGLIVESMTDVRHPASVRLGKKVKSLRLARMMSQQELAAAADTRQALVSSIESGDANPTLDSLIKLADAFGVEVGELFGTEKKHN